MRFRWIGRIAATAGVTLLLTIPGGVKGQAPGAPQSSALSIPTVQRMPPQDLNRLLHTREAEKPLVLQVGSRVMYQQAHIPGADYAGPASTPEGLKLLHDRVAQLNRETLIVIYCGCCPWAKCPNIGPAYHELRRMGFKNVKALYLENSFGADWANRGYPVATGQ